MQEAQQVAVSCDEEAVHAPIQTSHDAILGKALVES